MESSVSATFSLVDFVKGVYLPIIASSVLSGFFGGFFAGWFSNIFESKRRKIEKREDKYYEHRNTIVQIEHEILPSRVSLSRNIESIEDSIKNTNEANKRIVLRLFKLKLSSGLSLNLLNLELINKYADLFSIFESINNDIDYLAQIVALIQMKKDDLDIGLVSQYVLFSEQLLNELKIADSKSLELVSICKYILDKNDKKTIEKYTKSGGQIEYNFPSKAINKIQTRISREEKRKPKKGEVQPKFVALFFDIKRVPVRM